jgi:uncharacterized protein (TIGR02757 family)
VAARYHRTEHLGTDPLSVVREFSSPRDREVAGLFAALLAYGNVRQINASLRRLFNAMGRQPDAFVRGFDPRRDSPRLHGFKHRFTDSQDIACLCWVLKAAMGNGTLEDVFLGGFDADAADIAGSAARFVDTLLAQQTEPHFCREEMLAKTSFKHLLPHPGRGSACKRIYLFLRWMVRPDDGIDLGLWRRVPPCKLIVPVDSHILRIGRNVGILRRKSNSLAAAREITGVLRTACPDDPVRFDFPLCHLGILQECPTVSNLDACRQCELHDICEQRTRLEKSRSRQRHS